MLSNALGERLPGVMQQIPGREVHFVQETFHCLVIGQQLAVQPARIPGNQDIANIKDNRINRTHEKNQITKRG